MTLAPQRVPTLDSDEHRAMMASLTDLASAPSAAGTKENGKAESNASDPHRRHPAPAVETAGSPMTKAKKAVPGKLPTVADVSPKHLTLTVRQSTKEVTSKKAHKHQLAPVTRKQRGGLTDHCTSAALHTLIDRCRGLHVVLGK